MYPTDFAVIKILDLDALAVLRSNAKIKHVVPQFKFVHLQQAPVCKAKSKAFPFRMLLSMLHHRHGRFVQQYFYILDYPHPC